MTKKLQPARRRYTGPRRKVPPKAGKACEKFIELMLCAALCAERETVQASTQAALVAERLRLHRELAANSKALKDLSKPQLHRLSTNWRVA